MSQGQIEFLLTALAAFLKSQNPWNSPAATDSHFREHVLEYPQQCMQAKNQDKLETVFEFSKELTSILRRIFCREADRIGVEELASLILDLKLHFFSDNHISVLPWNPVTSVHSPVNSPVNASANPPISSPIA